MEQLHTKLIPLLQAVTSQWQDEEEDFQRGAPGKKKIPGNEGGKCKREWVNQSHLHKLSALT